MERLKYSDEDLINEIKRYYDEYGKVPTCNEIDKNAYFVNSNVIRNRFGSWNRAIQMAGFQVNIHKNINKEDVKREAIEFYHKNQRSPFYYELSFSKTAVNRLFGSWNDLLRECNLPLNQRDRLAWDKKYGIEKIREYYAENNKIPTATDLNKYGIHRKWLSGTFGSVQNALIESGLCNENDFPSKEERIARSMDFISSFYKSNGRPPSVAEYNFEAKKNKKIIWRRNLSNITGKKFSEICTSVIDDKVEYNKLGIGRYSIDKNGEFCRSYKEKMISNWLIDNKIDFRKEVKYSDIDPNIKEGYIMDWYLVKDRIVVELFGMYQNNYTPKDKIGYEYMLRTNSKINLCQERGIKLIPIFKQDKPRDILKKFQDSSVNIELTGDFLLM